MRASRAQLQVLGGSLPAAPLAAAPPGGGDAIALVLPAAAAAQARLVAQESSASAAAGLVQLGSSQEQLVAAAKPLEQASVIELRCGCCLATCGSTCCASLCTAIDRMPTLLAICTLRLFCTFHKAVLPATLAPLPQPHAAGPAVWVQPGRGLSGV